jgi:hydrogenase maturation protein HypF
MQGSQKETLKSCRIRLIVRGRVQGVGFRPAVYRYAVSENLSGFVLNSNEGVIIEAEGKKNALDRFIKKLKEAPPAQAIISCMEKKSVACLHNESGFFIKPSKRSGDLEVGMPPDLAICEECKKEIFSPKDRRYYYPFINCINCGPRYTIIKALPYDREKTTMSEFKMCKQCLKEYQEASTRRFDAQPNACSKCGPDIVLVQFKLNKYVVEEKGTSPEEVRLLMNKCGKLLKAGKILAVKGVGGFHFSCDGKSANAIRILRARKKRPHKPFAVMFKSIAEVRKHCICPQEAEKLLSSPAAPIVILKRKQISSLPKNIAPDTDDIGVILPYTPLHLLLLEEVSPLVMTSGNFSEEPIAINEDELKECMNRIADFAIVHNRTILRRCDDSVVSYRRDFLIPFRRSRGYIPEPIEMPVSGEAVLGVGAQQKNVVCLTRNNKAFLSSHIGEIDDLAAYEFFKRTIADFSELLEIKPEIVAHDMHPDYLSTRYVYEQKDFSRRLPVQHHHAHIAACMAEHNLTEDVLGIALDGTGFGPDDTIWGGELLLCSLKDFTRVGRILPFPLPGGELAIIQPERIAYGWLLKLIPEEADKIAHNLFPFMAQSVRKNLRAMILQNVNTPLTSSAGRVFDGVGVLLGVGETISYEGRAAIRLQSLAEKVAEKDVAMKSYPFEIKKNGAIWEIDFARMFLAIIENVLSKKETNSSIALNFHFTFVQAFADMCSKVAKEKGFLKKVVLSGGCFQNAVLLDFLKQILQNKGFDVYFHKKVPPNDACIAFGQVAVALANMS